MRIYSMAIILKEKVKEIHLFLLGGGVVTGIVLFSLLCLDTWDLLKDQNGRLVLSENSFVEVPSNLLQDKLAQIARPRRLPDADDGRERFMVRPGVSDELLLLAPRATLSEKVVGILSSTQQTRCIAIIESDGAQKSYQVGEKISGKSTILRILSDRVIINDNGYYASLIL
ncbi:hypothetical protein D781_3848 [Serratia sp. FGI94]|nr:hypothetical protein D781_3848 [Serratia sp. FGI94]